MEILQNLFNQLGNVVSAFEKIAVTFSAPLVDVVEEFPIINGLVGTGLLDVILNAFPEITLFGMMFSSFLGFTIVYSLVKWFLDIVL